MKKLSYQTLDPNLLIDCSQHEQVIFWAKTFHVSPQHIKTAIRACCDNSIASISAYLKNERNKSKSK